MSISRNTVLKSFIWKFLERGGSQAISFVMTIILARLLLPEEYGIIALILVFVNIANVIVDGGLNTALIQNKSSDSSDFDTIFVFSLLVSISIYFLLYCTAPFIAEYYGNIELVNVIRVLGISVILYSYNSVQRAYVSKHMLFAKLFRATFFSSILAGTLGILFAYNRFGVWSLVVYYLTLSVVSMIVLRLSIGWKPKIKFFRDRFEKLFDFGWKIFFSNLIITLFVNIRTLIIGKYYSPGTLAFFDRGRQFPSLFMENINASIQTVLFPAFSDAQEETDRVRMMLSRSIKTSCLLLFPILVGLCTSARPLVLFLLTDKWLDAVPYIQIFSLGYMLMPIQSANMQAIMSLGYSSVTLKLELIKKVLEVTILIVSVCISAYAVAWGVVLYNFICLFINLYPNNKLINYSISSQIKDIAPSLLCSVIMGTIIYPINLLPISCVYILILQLVLGILIYWSLIKFLQIEAFLYLESMFKTFLSCRK